MSGEQDDGAEVVDLFSETLARIQAEQKRQKEDPVAKADAERYEYNRLTGRAKAAGVPNDDRVFRFVVSAASLDTDAEQAATRCVQGYEKDFDEGLYRARFLFLSADVGVGKSVGACRAAVRAQGLSFMYLDAIRLARLHGAERERAENVDILILDEIGRDVSADLLARELILLRFNAGRLTIGCGNVNLTKLLDTLLDDPALLSRLEEQQNVYAQPFFWPCKGESLREKPPARPG